jgi:hypothetical protein
MIIDYRLFEEVPVARYNDYSILLEGEEGVHKKPHVHLKKKGERLASVAIVDGEVLAGKIPHDLDNLFDRWRTLHRDQLLEDWKGMQQNRRPREYEFNPTNF